MQSMTTPQLKVDKQQLNDMEAVPSAEVHIPVDGKRVLIHSWTCMLTSMIQSWFPQPPLPPVNNHVDDSEPNLPLPVTTP